MVLQGRQSHNTKTRTTTQKYLFAMCCIILAFWEPRVRRFDAPFHGNPFAASAVAGAAQRAKTAQSREGLQVKAEMHCSDEPLREQICCRNSCPEGAETCQRRDRQSCRIKRGLFRIYDECGANGIIGNDKDRVSQSQSRSCAATACEGRNRRLPPEITLRPAPKHNVNETRTSDLAPE
jgi:hypothetical protein